MVAIRTLRPVVPIHLPTKRAGRPDQRVHVTRRLVDHPPPTPLATPCRLWQGSIDKAGYGRHKAMRKGKRVTVNVHRWVVEKVMMYPLRKDQVVMHLCDNRLCYRYDHLRIGTAADNNADMVNKGRLVHVANSSPGESNPRAKLSQRQVDHIRRMYRDGLRQGTIAEHYGIRRSTVSRIVRGVTWATGPQRDLMAEARKRLEERGE